MTDASVVAVGTPQSFRQQLARSLELEAEEVGWVQSATAAEELLIGPYHTVDVLQLLASGMCFGIALVWLLMALRGPAEG